MKEIREYKKIVKGKPSEDYSEWVKRKSEGFDSCDEHYLKKFRKYYEIKLESCDDINSINWLINNIFYVLGMIFSPIITIAVAFGGRISEATLFYELHNGLLDIIFISGIILLILLFIVSVLRYIMKNKLIVDKMYYNDMIAIIDKKIGEEKKER